MSHFLRPAEVRGERAIGRPRAAVKVRIRSGGLWVESGILVARADARFVELPARVRVVGMDGEPIEPSEGARFFVSTETFDPFHLVVQVGP